MPYAKAVILEGLRWGRTVVNGVPKKITKDFKYQNYSFKKVESQKYLEILSLSLSYWEYIYFNSLKDTIILMNTHTVFFDEAFWGDPFVFRPERFIDESGEIISGKAERIGITFGAGKEIEMILWFNSVV